MDFANLLEGEGQAVQIEVLRASAVPRINNLGTGCQIRILHPPEDAGRYEVYEVVIAAGCVLDSQSHPREAREHLTVSEGSAAVTSGEAVEALEPGDTARYAADVPHRVADVAEALRALLVVQDA